MINDNYHKVKVTSFKSDYIFKKKVPNDIVCYMHVFKKKKL